MTGLEYASGFHKDGHPGFDPELQCMCECGECTAIAYPALRPICICKQCDREKCGEHAVGKTRVIGYAVPEINLN